MNMRPPNLPLGAILVVLATGLPLHAAQGQLFGSQFIRTSSDHVEVQSPNGYTAFAQIPLSSWLDLRLSFDKIAREYEGDGEICAHYAPNLGCHSEPTQTSTSLGTLAFSLLPSYQLTKAVRIGAGPSFGMTQISAERTAIRTGRRANFESPKTSQLRYSALLSLTVTPSPRIPLSLVGTAASHWLDFKQCVSYEEVYAPFCGSTRISEMGLGLAFQF